MRFTKNPHENQSFPYIPIIYSVNQRRRQATDTRKNQVWNIYCPSKHLFFLGPIDEFVDAMYRLANYMKQQNSRETQARGMRELDAINGEKGNGKCNNIKYHSFII